MGIRKTCKLTFTCVAAFLATGIWFTNDVVAQPGGPGGPSAPDQKIVEKYDDNKDGYLDAEERSAARADLKANNNNRRRRGRGRGGNQVGKPGPKVAVADASVHTNAKFYDPTVLRTLFLEFENDDWESELADFKPTDVEIPAKLTVDGMTLPNVGVSFRGASSFFSISPGLKRSLNISIDFMDEDQRLHGYKSLNLLNCNGDPSMMSSILYSKLAREKIAAPKVNYVKVVVNGESWGLYVSSQQFNKTFLQENFDTKKGARWKVNGSPRANGGLEYLGDDIEPYKERFDIKSKDKKSSWEKLVNLCRVLNKTPQDKLEEELSPILDIDGALWFLAVDVATVNSDGYWVRASDYSIYMHPDGKFHVLPHDMNESFQIGGGGGRRGGGGPGGRGRGGRGGFGPPADRESFDGPPRGGEGRRGPGAGGERGPGGDRGPGGGERGPGRDRGPGGGRGQQGGPGGGRGPGGGGHGGVDLDPLTGLDSERMPLRRVLLNHPKYQQQYLENLRTIAGLMKWENIGPTVVQHRDLIKDEVALDTRKLFATEDFELKTSDKETNKDSTSLRAFLQQRSEFLLNHPKIKALN